MKKNLQFNYFGEIQAFYYVGFAYTSLEEAEKMRRYHWEMNEEKMGEYFPITQSSYILGVPRFVNVEESLKTKKYCFYDMEELNLKCPSMSEYNP